MGKQTSKEIGGKLDKQRNRWASKRTRKWAGKQGQASTVKKIEGQADGQGNERASE